MEQTNPQTKTIMGWTFTPSWTMKEQVADLLEDRTWTDEDGNTIERKVLSSSKKGNHLWSVVELTKNGKTKRFIALDLLSFSKKDGAGYKGMTEAMGPCVYDCPLGFLDLVPEPERSTDALLNHLELQGGLTWRDKVRAYHETAKAKKSFTPQVGEVWELEDRYSVRTVVIMSVSPLIGGSNGGRYKMKPRMLKKRLS